MLSTVAWWKLSPLPFTEIAGNVSGQSWPRTVWWWKLHLSPGLELLELRQRNPVTTWLKCSPHPFTKTVRNAVPDQVTPWWKPSPYPMTEIVGNAAMQPAPLSRLGGNSHLTP
jgi:hypothetical protein